MLIGFCYFSLAVLLDLSSFEGVKIRHISAILQKLWWAKILPDY